MEEDREQLLKQDGYLIGIASLGLVNGMHFSPYFETAFVLLRPLLTNFYITSPVLQFYFASLVLAVSAVLIAGVPAAIFERMTGRKESDGKSLLLWLAVLGLISLLPLARMIGVR